MARLYISPSTQDHNAYAGGGTEEQWMRELSTRVCAHLIRGGHQVKMGGTVSATSNVNDANAWGATEAIAIHSNAGGGHGTEIWHYPGSARGELLARSIYKYLAPATSFADRGVKASDGYIETKGYNCPSVIIECAFHDNIEEANEIKASLDEWAKAIALGILDVVGGGDIAFPPAPVPTPPTPPSDQSTVIATLEAELDKVADLARQILTITAQ